MASRKIKPLDFDKAIKEVLTQYGEAVQEVMGEAIEDVSDKAVDKLKSVETFAPNGNPTGAYSRSWVSEEVRTGRLSKKRIIHNPEHYRLTHLLEKGHVLRNGTGRTFGRVPAYPHIAPVNDYVSEELPKEIERRISK